MKIQSMPPMVRRGVTQLMYVGDDEAVENATTPSFGTAVKVIGIGLVAIWLLGEISSRR